MYRANKTDKDVEYILNNLRYEDEMECRALFGENWKEETKKKIMQTRFYVMLGKGKSNEDETPICMGGIEQAEKDADGIGCAWFLCTDALKNHSIQILRELKKEVEKADEKFWLTYNVLYKENYIAKRWLKWLGYKFDNPRPQGIDVPEDFEFFYRVRPVKGLGE